MDKKSRMSLGANHLIFRNAGVLRNNPTQAEVVLWMHLRGGQLGTKFRRQHPLGIYIADFYSHQHKMIIEVDGSIHDLPVVAAADIVRENHLKSDGFRILRFTNAQIFTNMKKF